ncbi:C40 family peptidase [Alteribacter natronophilus]|uniref:C40 family peptidase n=1 Tax=Alteribacter natronophilus TaxID=2583810 RepID=UPI00110DCF7B|nr:peptidoglycan-binding protein [Alteribacter natronophilus]TMW72196.1 hypothetical protein FGB90_08260 [Alteribacter natronophilus]
MTLLSPKKTVMTASVALAGVVFASPSGVEASFGERTLSFGMSNNDVKVLQEKLKEEGFFSYHTATGYFGEVTRKAVKDFQDHHGLQVDGIAGPQTFGALSNGTGSESSEESSQPPAQTKIPDGELLRNGSSGTAVTLLQEKLKELGYYTSSVNGRYRSETVEAVRTYQRSNNLQTDGIAGPQTIGHLNSGNSKPHSPENSSENSGSDSGNGTPSLPANKVLRLNDRGSDVEALQIHLKEYGYYSFNITGTYGTITREAVRNFQREAGISVDGIAGPQTFNALKNWNGSSSGSGTTGEESKSGSGESGADSGGGSLLKVGSEGSAVTELQNELKTLGLFNVEPTGYYGSITKQSVKTFQQQWNLTSDGIATKATIEKISQAADVHRKEAESGGSGGNSGSGSFEVMDLIADASGFIGTPYVWGGASPSGFDCSGFIQYVFKQNGKTVPRTAAQQFHFGKSVTSPRVGDVVFFETYTSGPSHNGIYIGNNQFIHAGSSTGVTIANLNTNYWSSRYLGAKRLH